MVLLHARSLLTSTPQGRTDYIDADLRDTGTILTEASRTLDLSQPVAVLLIGVLHCIPDQDDPWGIVKRLMAAVPAGSYLVLGHPASDVETEASAAATADLNTKLAAPVKFRPRDEVARFLDGLEPVEPGLVQYPQWRPGPGIDRTVQVSAWCALAQKLS